MGKRKDSLQLYGSVVGEDVAGLYQRVRELLESGTRKVIKVSSADLEYIGVAGLQLLLAADRALRERGGELRLAGKSPQLEQALSLAGLAGALGTQEPRP